MTASMSSIFSLRRKSATSCFLPPLMLSMSCSDIRWMRSSSWTSPRPSRMGMRSSKLEWRFWRASSLVYTPTISTSGSTTMDGLGAAGPSDWNVVSPPPDASLSSGDDDSARNSRALEGEATISPAGASSSSSSSASSNILAMSSMGRRLITSTILSGSMERASWAMESGLLEDNFWSNSLRVSMWVTSMTSSNVVHPKPFASSRSSSASNGGISGGGCRMK
mmetsp:Transcript_21544/g.61063  ORF Transcript_21544/g.61063 Transcript_21544/m.61063 type:complete len:222 (-) Transcript_21544:816-1481(-)